ncbi:metallophosphoesterase [Sphingobium sp. HWE2-09]|uniref:metallophosphoesterase n=1 Tax=Sphingobium sp. HWE2-09 TaxID=3108390 RepID=UPI002DD35BD4|nr:metallophosphoesterase [Sphingobium sp. HWE2-09]
MAILFTADTHFGDHRTINIHKRPFASVAEMDAHISTRWNEVVHPDDTVWHLGDVARGAAHISRIQALNGIKHLVRGNNDDDGFADADIWASVTHYAEIEIDDYRLVLCHYPFRSWSGQHRGSINLHGHSHGKLKPMPRQFDVGVDAQDYAPVRLEDLLRPKTC